MKNLLNKILEPHPVWLIIFGFGLISDLVQGKWLWAILTGACFIYEVIGLLLKKYDRLS